MQKVPLGGERLGSGNKMNIALKGYERSTHDLGYVFRTTMSPGTLVPFMNEIALPGDTFDIDLDAYVNTHPTIGPLFGSYKLQLDVFMCPIRLYNSLLHNNALGIGRQMSKVKIPTITLTAVPIPDITEDIDNAQINPSCLLAYLGIRGVGQVVGATNQERSFNAVGILQYWDVYKNYYANKQEEIGAVIHTPAEALVETVDSINANGDIPQSPAVDLIELGNGQVIVVNYTGVPPHPDQIMIHLQYAGWRSLEEIWNFTNDTGTTLEGVYNFRRFGLDYATSWDYRSNDDLIGQEPKVVTFELKNIDDMRTAILAYSSTTAPFDITTTLNNEPYSYLAGITNNIPNMLATQEGLAVKTYQSDQFNNWLNQEWIDGTDGVSNVTAIDTSTGEFTIDTFLISKKVFDMLNRIAVSGGTYKDWIETVYDNGKKWLAETPMYMGGLIKEIVFQEVVSTSAASDDGTQPLGTLAGKGTLNKKHKGGHVVVRVDEPGYIMGLVSITPRIDYSQGNRWDVHLQTLDDLHKPQMDEIGFQDLITEKMAWWSTRHQGGQWNTFSAGKQPAWLDYMTNTNRVFGNFAMKYNEMFMTLNRRYEYNSPGEILDLTTYIDPVKFNFIFAETSLDAMNFWVQLGVDITARRVMSYKVMPNL